MVTLRTDWIVGGNVKRGWAAVRTGVTAMFLHFTGFSTSLVCSTWYASRAIRWHLADDGPGGGEHYFEIFIKIKPQTHVVEVPSRSRQRLCVSWRYEHHGYAPHVKPPLLLHLDLPSLVSLAVFRERVTCGSGTQCYMTNGRKIS